MVYLLNMVIFHSYVKLPEGKRKIQTIYQNMYPDYHNPDVLSRVLFNKVARVFLFLIGRDQPKVVLLNIFWNVGVD